MPRRSLSARRGRHFRLAAMSSDATKALGSGSASTLSYRLAVAARELASVLCTLVAAMIYENK